MTLKLKVKQLMSRGYILEKPWFKPVVAQILPLPIALPGWIITGVVVLLLLATIHIKDSHPAQIARVSIMVGYALIGRLLG